MNIKRILITLVFCIAFIGTAFLLYNCGSSGSSSSSITITISPANGSTAALNAEITATFSGAITEPTNWDTVFTVVVKDGDGTNICEGNIVYSDLVATCSHEGLTDGTTYVATVSGAKDANGKDITTAISEFTASASAGGEVTLTKSSVKTATDGSGSITLTITIASASSSISKAAEAPTITVTSQTTGVTDPTVGDCETSDDLTYTCTVTGLAGCKTFADYLITISSSSLSEDYTMMFNSADDEFEWSDTSEMIGDGKCWRDITGGTGTISTSNGKLVEVAPQPSSGTNKPQVEKQFTNNDINFAMATLMSDISTFSSTVNGNWSNQFKLHNSTDDTEEFQNMIMQAYFGGEIRDFWLINGFISTTNETIYAKDTAPEADYNHTNVPYMCMVQYNGIITTYLSADGINWSKVEADNMECDSFCTTVPPLIDYDASSWDGFYAVLNATNEHTSAGTFSASFDFIRFNTYNITGVAGDCPVIE